MSLGMFRTQALKRVSSPEQLDRVVRAALPLQWVALAALLLVVGTVVIWSVVATVPTTVSAQGIYVPVGGLRVADTTTSGIVTNLASLSVGAHVEAGEVLGTITSGEGASASSTPIVSPATGTLIEVNDVTGSYVDPGQNVATIEPSGKPLVVYAYLPAEVASTLVRGVPANVTFGAGIGATFGYVKGVVASVSRYPVSAEHLDAVLGDTGLAAQVLKLGAVKEVVVALVPSAATPSRLTWASGAGPPAAVPPGVPASLQFIVGSHRPINDVI
jgi:hypothetical protein